MFLSAKINGGTTAEFELNFTNNTWSLAPAQAKWANVMFSDRGVFEIKNWGVIWLMDGLGTKKDSAVILHDAPTGEKDEKHSAGTGAAYAPALAKYKDAEIHWQVLRKSTPTELTASRTSGPLTAVRVKAKQICEGLLPKAGLTNGTRPATGTACGEFPGRVLRRMPVKGGGQPGAFSLQVTGSGLLYLTSPTTHWESFGKAIDAKYQPTKKCWVDFGTKLPKTGDIYVLSKFENQGAFQHVGMIISSEGQDWITADGGQGNGGQSGFISRKFHSSGQIDGEFGAKAWLKGWVDLDNLRECLAEYFPKELA
jgi:hypothetical protein